MNKKAKNGLEMAAFTVPAIILVCLMMYVPFILSGYYSLTEWNGISKAVKFVGFTNFKTLFSQGGDFLPALWFTTKYTFCFVVFSNVLALALAVLMTLSLAACGKKDSGAADKVELPVADGAVIGKKAVPVILYGFDQPGRNPLHPQKKSQSAAIVFRRHGIAQNGHSAALLKAYLRVLYHKTTPYANPNVWNGARKKSAQQKTALPQESCPCYFCDCLSSAARSSTGLRYCPVKESGFCATSSGVPVATMVPPPLPPSGPRSMI